MTCPFFSFPRFLFHVSAAAKSLQSCPTLCNPIDDSPPGYPVPGILQARTLEWAAISFSNAWKWKVRVKLLSRVRLLVTPWTAAHQAPLSMKFSRQEYWSGVPLPSPYFMFRVLQTVPSQFSLGSLSIPPVVTDSQLDYIAQFVLPKTDLWTQIQSFLVKRLFFIDPKSLLSYSSKESFPFVKRNPVRLVLFTR